MANLIFLDKIWWSYSLRGSDSSNAIQVSTLKLLWVSNWMQKNNAIRNIGDLLFNCTLGMPEHVWPHPTKKTSICGFHWCITKCKKNQLNHSTTTDRHVFFVDKLNHCISAILITSNTLCSMVKLLSRELHKSSAYIDLCKWQPITYSKSYKRVYNFYI